MSWARVGLLAGIAVVGLAIIWLLGSAGRSRARTERLQIRAIRHVSGRAEWIHDELSLAVMPASPSSDRLRIVWADARRRINDLAAEATSLATRDRDQRRSDDLRRVSQALGRLAGALDVYVGGQLQGVDDAGRADTIAAASDTVQQRRTELLTALAPLRARV